MCVEALCDWLQYNELSEPSTHHPQTTTSICIRTVVYGCVPVCGAAEHYKHSAHVPVSQNDLTNKAVFCIVAQCALCPPLSPLLLRPPLADVGTETAAGSMEVDCVEENELPAGA